MLRVAVDINGEVDVATLTAVRTKPKTKTVKDGTMCTYNIVYNNTVVGNMKGTYGCGVDLAIQLLEQWKENSDVYKFISFYKTMEKMDEEFSNKYD